MELRAETSVFDDKLLKEDIDNAQETADNAQVIAGTTAQYFWFLEEIGSVPAGVGTGAHITNKTKEEFLYNPANGGGNLLARSNGIAIRDGLTELAYFSGTAAQIGKSNSYNSYFDAQSFQIRNGSTLLSKFTSNGTDIYLANDSANSIASFGTTVRIGVNNGKRVEVKSDGVYVYNGTTQYGYFGSFARIGDYYSNNVKMDSSGVKINTSQDNVVASFGSTTTIGKTSKNYIEVTDSGLNFYDGANSQLFGRVYKGDYSRSLKLGAAKDDYTYGTLQLRGQDGQGSITVQNGTSSSNKWCTLTLTSTACSLALASYTSSGGTNYDTTLQLTSSKLALYYNGIDDSAIKFSVVPSNGNVNTSGYLKTEGRLESGSVIVAGSDIRLPNGAALQAKDTGGNYRDLVHLNGNNNFVLGTNNISGDCFIYRVYTSKTGTVSTVPNVRILDNHRLTRTTHANSSIRYKHDIKNVTNKELDPHNLYNIEVKQFRYNDDIITDPSDCRYNKELVGFIAEQVRECYPIAVDVNDNDECEAWSPQYIVPPMLALIQEQHREIEMLKQRIGGY